MTAHNSFRTVGLERDAPSKSNPSVSAGIGFTRLPLQKLFRFLVITLPLVWLPAACGRETHDEAPAPRQALVGLAIHFTFDDYAKSFVRAFRSVMDHSDALYEIADAEGDGDRQADQIRAFAAKRVDALVVVPINDAQIVDAVNEAAALGIPVISVTEIPNARVAASIPGNDRPNGAAAAELLVEKLHGQGEVVVYGATGHAHRIDERLAGFEEVISQSNLEVVEICDSISRAFLIDETIRILSERPAVRGVFGVAGIHAESVATALRMMERKDVVVTGVDANTEILDLIGDGHVTGAAAQYPWMHGEYAAKLGLDLIRQNPPRAIPKLPTVVITARNLDLGPKLLDWRYAELNPAPAVDQRRR